MRFGANITGYRLRLRVGSVLLAVVLAAAWMLAAPAQHAWALAIQVSYQGMSLDGATDVPVDMGPVAFYFDHNVATRFEQNKELFYLEDDEGTAVEIEVYTLYDASEPDDPNLARRWIYVQPACELEPSTTYALGVRAGVEANAGVYPAFEVTFSTAAGGGKGEGCGSGDGQGEGENPGSGNSKGGKDTPGGSSGGTATTEPDEVESPQTPLPDPDGTEQEAEDPKASKPASLPAQTSTAYKVLGGGGGGSAGEGEGPAEELSEPSAFPLLVLLALALAALGCVRRELLWKRHLDGCGETRGGSHEQSTS